MKLPVKYNRVFDKDDNIVEIEKVNADNIEIIHLCPSRDGSSGSPIINYNTFKVVAIHTGRHKTKN